MDAPNTTIHLFEGICLLYLNKTDYLMQVSHHPPISAFYAEHAEKRMSVNAHIYTKSSFLGMSVSHVRACEVNESLTVTSQPFRIAN